MERDLIIGQHNADIASMKSDIADIQRDVREIRDIIVEKRGERRIAMYGIGAVGGITSPVILKIILAKFGFHN